MRTQHDIPTLTLIGAGEFATDSAWPDPGKTGPGTAAATRAAYNLLSVDSGGLYGATADWFRKEGGKLPSNFAQVGEATLTRRFSKGGIKIAVIFFPALYAEEETNVMTARAYTAVLAAGRNAADADLIIGVSPWGLEAEKTALSSLSRMYHVLLGGGPGGPFPGTVPDNAPGVLWARPDRRGRSITVLDFFELPAHNQSHIWTMNVNVEAREAVLDENVPEDPAMVDVLKNLR